MRASISTCSGPSDVARAAIFSFGTQLHTHLRGLVLSAARLPEPWERVARLDFAHRLDGDVVRSMHIEIMGRTSNVVVTNEEGRILLCAYQVLGQKCDACVTSIAQVGSKMSSVRQVQTGSVYQLPPPGLGLSPSPSLSLDEWRSTLTSVAANDPTRCAWTQCCVRAFRGVSPTLAAQLAAVAGCGGGAVHGIRDDEWQRLYAAWQAWLTAVEHGTWVV